MGGGWGRGSRQGSIAKLEASKGARSVLQLCVRGEEAGRFALLLLCSPLAFLGHQEKALARRTGGSWSWGTRRACWCNILPSFICFPSLSALQRGKCRCHWSWGGGGGRRKRQRRRGEEEEEEEETGAEDILPAFQGHMEPRACAGGQAERVVQPVFRQGYLLSKSSWLLCLSCVTLEVGVQAGEWQELDAVEAAWPVEVPLHSDAGVLGLGCSGALASRTSAVIALTPEGSHSRF